MEMPSALAHIISEEDWNQAEEFIFDSLKKYSEKNGFIFDDQAYKNVYADTILEIAFNFHRSHFEFSNLEAAILERGFCEAGLSINYNDEVLNVIRLWRKGHGIETESLFNLSRVPTHTLTALQKNTGSIDTEHPIRVIDASDVPETPGISSFDEIEYIEEKIYGCLYMLHIKNTKKTITIEPNTMWRCARKSNPTNRWKNMMLKAFNKEEMTTMEQFKVNESFRKQFKITGSIFGKDGFLICDVRKGKGTYRQEQYSHQEKIERTYIDNSMPDRHPDSDLFSDE